MRRNKFSSLQLSRIGRRRSVHRLRSTRVVCHDATAIQDARDQQPNTFPTRLAPCTESEKGLWEFVARKMSRSDVVRVPCARSTRMAYIRLELDDSRVVTWSTAVSLSFMVTPRIRRLDTRSTSGRGGGGARIRLAVITISFVLSWYVQ